MRRSDSGSLGVRNCGAGLRSAPRPFRQRTTAVRRTQLCEPSVGSPSAARSCPAPAALVQASTHRTWSHLTRLLIARHRAQPPGNSIRTTGQFALPSSSFFSPDRKGERKLAGHVSLPSSPESTKPTRIRHPPTLPSPNDSHGVQRTRGPRARDGRRVHLDSGGGAEQVRGP